MERDQIRLDRIRPGEIGKIKIKKIKIKAGRPVPGGRPGGHASVPTAHGVGPPHGVIGSAGGGPAGPAAAWVVFLLEGSLQHIWGIFTDILAVERPGGTQGSCGREGAHLEE